MKPLYIFLLMFAVFITGLSDGISWALLVIPGIGFVLAIAITFCINATMGVGLLFLLALNGMYHPKFGPAGFVVGLIPVANFLPVWIGLVIAGIMQKTSEEGGLLGAAAQVAVSAQSMKSPASVMGAVSLVQNVRQAPGRPPMPEADNDNEETGAEKAPRSRIELKSPNMNRDITRPQYAKAA